MPTDASTTNWYNTGSTAGTGVGTNAHLLNAYAASKGMNQNQYFAANGIQNSGGSAGASNAWASVNNNPTLFNSLLAKTGYSSADTLKSYLSGTKATPGNAAQDLPGYHGVQPASAPPPQTNTPPITPTPQTSTGLIQNAANPNGGVNTNLQMKPGETPAQYNQRIAGTYANLPAPGMTSQSGVTNTAPSSGTQSGMIPSPAAPTNPNVDTSRGGLLQSQANTASQNPLSDPKNPLVANLKSAQDQYAALKSNIATQFGKMETSDQSLPVVLGQEEALQKQYAGQLDALAQAVNTAQTALQQAVSAYSAQTSAQNAATTQTQPGNQFTQVSPANTLYGANGQPVGGTGGTGSNVSPLTGQPFTSTGNPKIDSVVSAALQQIANGSGYSNALSATGLSSYGPAAMTALQSGLPAGFNPNASDATASGQASVLASLPPMKGALSAANGIQDQITTYLNQNPDINSNMASVANAAQQWLAGKQLSDPRYQNLFNMLSEYSNTIAPVLGVGGDPTNMKTQIATDFINAQQQGGSIYSVLQNLNQVASAKIPNITAGATGKITSPTVPYTGGSSASTNLDWGALTF